MIIEEKAMFLLKNKIAFISGGASGIGLAVAKRFVQAGANVVIGDLQDNSPVLEELGARFIQLDVSDEQQVADTLAAVENDTGKLDVLVNNAGIVGKDGIPIEEGDSELLKKVFEINTFGVYYGLKYGPKHMHDGGSIINTSSQGAFTNIAGSSQYNASKAAVVSLTKMAAVELGHRRIRVNAVCPTFTRTPMMKDAEEFTSIAETMIPMGRIGTTDDLVGVYHFLAAPESAFFTGQTMIVDGGWTAGVSNAALEKLMG
jgi:NAD(P)-dependent dehydrogenase (short-subunit alcohol dehydrogenase family)